MKKLPLSALWLITGILLSCQQDEDMMITKPADDCLTTRSASNGSVIEGQYIVSFADRQFLDQRATPDLPTSVLKRYNVRHEGIIRRFRGESSNYVMRLSKNELTRLQSDADVAAIEPDRIVSMCACFTVIDPDLVTWNVDKVGYGDGIGKTAWIIDSGIDLDHPDLDVDEARSRSFIRGDRSADDDNGHGTHVAGIIGGKNNRIGVLGVASGATLVALKVLDKDGEGSLSAILNALAYVRHHGKAGDVVNLSLGVDEISNILEREIEGLARLDIFVAIAAGNDRKPANEFSPARAHGNNIYTVSAVDSLNRFASFSNYGSDVVDYAAPGVRILSTYRGNRYAIMSGTSMATPHVAGLLLITNGKIGSAGHALNDPDGIPDPLAHR